MNSLDDILSQPATRVLRRALEQDHLPSAYLFEGPSGVGKQKAALALATEAITGGAPEPDVLANRIASGAHPDVRTFGPRDEGGRNIQVEFLRKEVLPFAQYAPFEASSAFVIFPQADVSFPAAHPESANALLKTLEEPRAGVHFMLLAERPERLLPTIRSRCQRLRFGRLPPLVLERVLRAAGVAEAALATAITLADGQADRALALAEEGEGDGILERALNIDAALETNRPGSITALAEELARMDDLPMALETLCTYYRDVAAAALGLPDSELAFSRIADRVRKRSSTLSPAGAAARVELIRRTTDTFERNANKQLALDALLFRLGEVR